MLLRASKWILVSLTAFVVIATVLGVSVDWKFATGLFAMLLFVSCVPRS